MIGSWTKEIRNQWGGELFRLASWIDDDPAGQRLADRLPSGQTKPAEIVAIQIHRARHRGSRGSQGSGSKGSYWEEASLEREEKEPPPRKGAQQHPWTHDGEKESPHVAPWFCVERARFHRYLPILVPIYLDCVLPCYV